MTAETKNKPVERIQVGQVKIAIFRNAGEDGETFYNSVLEHQYKDKKDDKWKDSSRYSQRELLHLAKAALAADSAIFKLRAADKAAKGETADNDEQAEAA